MSNPVMNASSDVDLQVVGQIISAIGILHVFPTETEIGNFLMPVLKGVPGCGSASICFRNLARPLGDVQGSQCLACARGLDQREESGAYHCGLVEPGKVRAYPLQTVDGFYGYLVLKVAAGSDYNKYEPFIRNLGNALALVLENRLQQAELRAAKSDLEQQVEERTRELARVGESSGDMIAMVDTTHRFTLFNSAFHDGFQRICGVEFKQGDSIAQVLEHIPNDLAVVKEYWDRALAGEEFTVTHEFAGENMQRLWYELHFSPVRDSDGKVACAIHVASNITDRKQAEEMSNRLAAIIESSDDAIIGKDLNGVITSWNRGAEKIFGYSAAEMEGTSILRLIPPERRQEEHDIQEKIRSGDSVVHCETLRQAKDGRVLAVSVTTSPIKNADGTIVGVSKVARDITDRKQAEEAMRKSEQKFRIVADFTYDWEYWVGGDEQMIYVSPSCERVTGYTREEFYSDNHLLKKIIHPEDAQTFDAHLRETHVADFTEVRDRLASKPSDLHYGNGVEYRIIKKDGSVVHIGHLCQPVFDDGCYLGRRISSRDITDRKAAEARIEHLTHLYDALSHSNQAIVHSASVEDLLPTVCRDVVELAGMEMAWIGMVDEATGMVRPVAASGIGTECTEGIKISGKPEDSLESGPIGTAIREDRAVWCLDFQNDPSATPWRKNGLHNGWAAIAALPLHREDRAVGALCLHSSNSEFFNDDARGLLEEIATDVSFALDSFAHKDERKRTEKALEKKNAEMERFTYTVSHDLKSPLITIKTFLGYLEKDLEAKKTESVIKDLAYIHCSADKMGGLLDDLLKLARIGHTDHQPEVKPLQEIVKEAIILVAGGIAERSVQVEVTEKPIWLTGDRNRLVEVFQNLLDNAVKFLGDQPKPRIEIGWEQDGGDIVLFVRDNGNGIEAQHQDKIFGLFEKLDSSAPGSGMGLAQVRKIVEMHGGKIWVESEGLGHGSTFRFTLAKTQLRQ